MPPVYEEQPEQILQTVPNHLISVPDLENVIHSESSEANVF